MGFVLLCYCTIVKYMEWISEGNINIIEMLNAIECHKS